VALPRAGRRRKGVRGRLWTCRRLGRALFSQAPGFVRTELLREGEGSYATLDYWSDLVSFAAFRRAFGEDYARLDAECETLTEAEERLGLFEVTG
jgi:heme-degrading monooxygenase HmoA